MAPVSHRADPEAFRRLDQLVQRQFNSPAVGHERLVKPSVDGPAVVRVPAVQRRHVLEIVLAEEAEHLQLGVDARLQAAVDEDQLLVEHDGRSSARSRSRTVASSAATR